MGLAAAAGVELISYEILDVFYDKAKFAKAVNKNPVTIASSWKGLPVLELGLENLEDELAHLFGMHVSPEGDQWKAFDVLEIS